MPNINIGGIVWPSRKDFEDWKAANELDIRRQVTAKALGFGGSVVPMEQRLANLRTTQNGTEQHNVRFKRFAATMKAKYGLR